MMQITHGDEWAMCDHCHRCRVTSTMVVHMIVACEHNRLCGFELVRHGTTRLMHTMPVRCLGMAPGSLDSSHDVRPVSRRLATMDSLEAWSLGSKGHLCICTCLKLISTYTCNISLMLLVTGSGGGCVACGEFWRAAQGGAQCPGSPA